MSVSLFTDVPIEIRQYYAQNLDLIDLYSMIKTCKSWKQICEEDLGFQKACLMHTSTSLRYRNRKVRNTFQMKRAMQAIRDNDPTNIVFCVPNGSCHDVAEMLIASDGITFMPSKDLLLNKIRLADADKVLTYLLECCGNEYSKDFSSVVSIICKEFLRMNEIEADRNKKALHVVLSFLKRSRDNLLCALIETADGDWSYSNMPAVDFFRNLLDYLKHFPEYAIDLDAQYANEPDGPYKMNPLAHAVINGNEAMFDLLLQNGAKFDPKQPYLAYLYYHFGLGRESLRNKLYKMGADLSVPLPPHVKPICQSILLNAVEAELSNWLVEHLLFKGAKLLPEEEKEWLLKPKNSIEHSIASHLISNTPYNLTNREVDMPPIVGEGRLFSNFMDGTYVRLFGNGNFEKRIGYNAQWVRHKYKGQYRIEGSKLVLYATIREDYNHGNSYEGPNYTDTEIDAIVDTYKIFKTSLNFLAIVSEDIASTEGLVDNMLISTHKMN